MVQATCTLPIKEILLDLYVIGVGKDGPEEVLAAVHRSDPPQEYVPLLRIHSACATGDILDSARCDCGSQLSAAMDRIIHEDYGVLLYLLRHEGRGIGLANKIRAYALQDQGLNTIDANLALGLPVDSRDYSPAIAALQYLGIDRVRLVTNNPQKVHALTAASINVVERISLNGFVTSYNIGYLKTKDAMMGHFSSAGPCEQATEDDTPP